MMWLWPVIDLNEKTPTLSIFVTWKCRKCSCKKEVKLRKSMSSEKDFCEKGAAVEKHFFEKLLALKR